MILERALVIIQQSQITLGINMEVIGSASVLKIVASRRNNHRKDFKFSEPVQHARVRYQKVNGLRHVGRVFAVVVGILEDFVASL